MSTKAVPALRRLTWVAVFLLIAAGFAGPAEASASAVPAPGVSVSTLRGDEDVYESERYGYTITYDPSNWQITEEDANPDDVYDRVTFTNESGRSIILIIGDPDYEADELNTCITEYVAGLENAEGITDIEPVDEQGAEGEEDNRAWATTSYTVVTASTEDEDIDVIWYTECRWMGDGVTVVIVHTTIASDYEDEIDEREDLLAGLESPGSGLYQLPGFDRNGQSSEEELEPLPVFRGGAARTGVQPGPGPEGELSVRWVLELLPFDDSSPTAISPSIFDGLLYVMREEGLHAIEASSGEERWLFEADAWQTAVPAVTDGVVYFHATDGVFAVDAADGTELWMIEEQGDGDASPAVAEGYVYIPLDNGELIAVGAGTGEEMWRVNAGSNSSPTVVGGVVYTGGYISGEGYVLMALDAGTGDEQWQISVSSELAGPLVFDDGRIFAGGDDGVLYVFDAASGEALWQFADESPGNGGLAPAVGDGTVYYSSWDGAFVALESETGDVIWQEDLGGDGVYPVIVGDAVYVFPPATLLILDAESGEERAELADIGDTIGGGGVVFSAEFISTSPLVVDGVIYVVLDDGVLAIEGNDER